MEKVSNQIRVVVKGAGKAPVEKMVENNLKSFQALVGGNIQAVPFCGFVLVCNEMHKCLNLPGNFWFGSDFILGDVFFVGADSEDFASLTDEQVELVQKKFSTEHY